jgi:hypothetical protein
MLWYDNWEYYMNTNNILLVDKKQCLDFYVAVWCDAGVHFGIVTNFKYKCAMLDMND